MLPVYTLFTVFKLLCQNGRQLHIAMGIFSGRCEDVLLVLPDCFLLWGYGITSVLWAYSQSYPTRTESADGVLYFLYPAAFTELLCLAYDIGMIVSGKAYTSDLCEVTCDIRSRCACPQRKVGRCSPCRKPKCLMFPEACIQKICCRRKVEDSSKSDKVSWVCSAV